jgi:hypothetical protein
LYNCPHDLLLLLTLWFLSSIEQSKGKRQA